MFVMSMTALEKAIIDRLREEKTVKRWLVCNLLDLPCPREEFRIAMERVEINDNGRKSLEKMQEVRTVRYQREGYGVEVRFAKMPADRRQEGRRDGKRHND